MRKNTKKIVIIAICIIILLVIALGGYLLYATTDFLKSDQELFFKYLAQDIDVVEQYLQDPNQNIKEQIKSESYVVNSNIKFDLESKNAEIANQTILPRNFNIDYVKNADPKNNRDLSEAKLSYLGKDLFTIQYAHDGDVYAVNGVNETTSSKILNVYLGIENNNLKQLAEKLGIQNISNIPNKIGNVSLLDVLTLNETDKDYIQNLLVNMMNSQIQKNNYHHDKGITIEMNANKMETNCYSMTLSNDEYKKLIIAILNEVSQNETLLNIILQKIILIDPRTDMQIASLRQQLQDEIAQITTKTFEDGMTIRVYEKDGKVVRTQIEKNSTTQYVIDHERTNNAVRTLISINDQQNQENSNKIKSVELAKETSDNKNNMIISVNYEDDTNSIKSISLQSKTELYNQELVNNIVININDSNTTYFTIKINSNMVANNNIQIEELNKTNSVVVNDRSKENILQLWNAITAQLQKVYEQYIQVIKELQQEDTQNQLIHNEDIRTESNTITNDTNTIVGM